MRQYWMYQYMLPVYQYMLDVFVAITCHIHAKSYVFVAFRVFCRFRKSGGAIWMYFGCISVYFACIGRLTMY